MTNHDRLLEQTILDYRAGNATALTVERAAREAQSAHFALLIGRLIARLRRGRAATPAVEPGRPVAETA
jgi:hypothetical protein